MWWTLWHHAFLASPKPSLLQCPQNRLLPLQGLVPLAQKQTMASAIRARCMWKMQHCPPVDPFHVRCITYCYFCETSSIHTLKLKETFLYSLSRLSNTYVDCPFPPLAVHLSLSQFTHHACILATRQGINYKMDVLVMAKVGNSFRGWSHE